MKVSPFLCLALAATAQAYPALEVVNQVANILTIITSAISLSNPAVPSKITVSTAIGYNGVNDDNRVVGGEGTSSGYDGPFPLIGILADDKSVIAVHNEVPYIDSGDKKVVEQNILNNKKHYKANIIAGDAMRVRTAPATYNFHYVRNAICFKYVAITPDRDQSDTKPYVVTAELLIKLYGAPWYYSGDRFNYYSTDGKCTIQSAPLPCVWLSAFAHDGMKFIERVSISDVDVYRMAFRTSPMDENKIKSLLDVGWSQYPDKPNIKLEEGKYPEITKRAEEDDTVMIDSEYSAATLCVDRSSYGPSFVSEREKLYCNMKTRELYPLCEGNVTSSCYQIKNEAISVELGSQATRRNGMAAPAKMSLPLRRFPKRESKHHRRVVEEPDCVVKQPMISWTPAVTGYYVSGDVAKDSDLGRINQRLAWMNERSAKDFEASWVDYDKGHDARFECKKDFVRDLAGCQRCIKFATDSSWSVLQSHTAGRINLNCGSIQFSLKSGGSGSSCKRKLGRGDGKVNECCETSEDCELICDVNDKKCRPGVGVCPNGLNPYKFGRGKKDGRTGDCCKSGSDCVGSCKDKQCDGGSGGGSSCKRKLRREDGKVGECCETSDDCELICDVSSKMCRPGVGACPNGLNPYKFGRGKKDGRTGDCCKSSSDCVGSCKDKQCDGGSGGGSSCKRKLRREDGKVGECCETSEDCELICDVNDKKCRPGVGACANGLNPYKYGRGKKDGRTGDCCASSSDCVGSCNNKQCDSGSGGGGGGKCSRKLGREDGKVGECCQTSDDCELICDVNDKKCRPGVGACPNGSNPYKFGRGKKDGRTGDCCKSGSDCVGSCNNKQCDR